VVGRCIGIGIIGIGIGIGIVGIHIGINSLLSPHARGRLGF